jgi:hypothetical protein
VLPAHAVPRACLYVQAPLPTVRGCLSAQQQEQRFAFLPRHIVAVDAAWSAGACSGGPDDSVDLAALAPLLAPLLMTTGCLEGDITPHAPAKLVAAGASTTTPISMTFDDSGNVLAAQGAACPPPWEVRVASGTHRGRCYFFNRDTSESRWTLSPWPASRSSFGQPQPPPGHPPPRDDAAATRRWCGSVSPSHLALAPSEAASSFAGAQEDGTPEPKPRPSHGPHDPPPPAPPDAGFDISRNRRTVATFFAGVCVAVVVSQHVR